jgi:UDP-N-acetylglucosamine 1-carboxyvinyltransferase
MDKIQVHGGRPLKGTIAISGAKNAALPLMTACLLTHEPLTLTNVPELGDVHTLANLLQHLGVHVDHSTLGTLALTTTANVNTTADYDLVRKMRASFLVLGPLVARHGHAKVSLPGGCAIGTRPVDLHLDGLRALGSHIHIEDGYVVAEAPKGLRGAHVQFPSVSVTGTENILMAATLAKGETRISNAALEPEVTDLANCLVAMGAKIDGIGTDTLVVQGVSDLYGTKHPIVFDRIEAGTYAMAAAITGGDLTLKGADIHILETLVHTLRQMGVEITKAPHGMHVVSPEPKDLKPLNMITEPYPGYPTDLQAQLMSLLTLVPGTSTIHENLFENRFMHVAELSRLGANVHVHGNHATIIGVDHLIGAPVMASDLRASASLILAGLAAQGTTIVNRIYHLDRGYSAMEEKLRACGADIERIRSTE